MTLINRIHIALNAALITFLACVEVVAPDMFPVTVPFMLKKLDSMICSYGIEAGTGIHEQIQSESQGSCTVDEKDQ